MLCADLVDIQWTDENGKKRRTVANLEDISLTGACVHVDAPIAPGTRVHIAYPKGELKGSVRYCVYRDIGYFLGLEFEPGHTWSPKQFTPQHMLDPRRLVCRAAQRSVRSPLRTAPRTVAPVPQDRSGS